ncbi:hypothetical protein [Chryseobacterium sp. 2987]|uniref:hypothetical protein n=1 Tax=Chryseobacterium sp. 2987 TaxID=2817767 RepID=UPI00285B82C4|nr:hypothetical protein [Chryseobacterium sp. 2987]MDR6919846.1 hypothetical protein [Chryseobacterium sp. 2987]
MGPAILKQQEKHTVRNTNTFLKARTGCTFNTKNNSKRTIQRYENGLYGEMSCRLNFDLYK